MKFKLLFLLGLIFPTLFCSHPVQVNPVFISNSDTLSVLMFKDTLNVNFYYGIYMHYTYYNSEINITELNNDNLMDTVRFIVKYSGDAYSNDTTVFPNFEWSNDTLYIWYTDYLFKQDSSSLSGRLLRKELSTPARGSIKADSIWILKSSSLFINVIPKNY